MAIGTALAGLALATLGLFGLKSSSTSKVEQKPKLQTIKAEDTGAYQRYQQEKNKKIETTPLGTGNTKNLLSDYLNVNQTSADSINTLNQEGVAARQWQEYMSNTAHQREVQDLQKAGLNPVLSAGGSGAQGYTASSGAQDKDLARLQALVALEQTKMNNKTALETAKIGANAQLGSAQLGYLAQHEQLGARYLSALGSIIPF